MLNCVSIFHWINSQWQHNGIYAIPHLSIRIRLSFSVAQIVALILSFPTNSGIQLKLSDSENQSTTIVIYWTERMERIALSSSFNIMQCYQYQLIGNAKCLPNSQYIVQIRGTMYERMVCGVSAQHRVQSSFRECWVIWHVLLQRYRR